MARINFLGGTGIDGYAPTDWHVYFEDFELYLATSWVITETGSGTRAISQADGGVLVITNAAADNDVNSLQARDVASGQVAEHWKFVVGKPMYFGIRFKIADATQSDFVVGLHITATTPVASAPGDGIYFRKDDGDRLIDLVGRKNAGGSEVAGVLGTSGYMTDDTWTILEWYYDGVSSAIQAFQDGVGFGSIPLTNVVDDEELAVSFAFQNGEAVAKVASVDWIKVAKLGKPMSGSNLSLKRMFAGKFAVISKDDEQLFGPAPRDECEAYIAKHGVKVAAPVANGRIPDPDDSPTLVDMREYERRKDADLRIPILEEVAEIRDILLKRRDADTVNYLLRQIEPLLITGSQGGRRERYRHTHVRPVRAA